jgi:hypothetical protein
MREWGNGGVWTHPEGRDFVYRVVSIDDRYELTLRQR